MHFSGDEPVPLDVDAIRALEASLPEPETAPEAFLVETIGKLIATLRHEQERHAETRYEWEQACERVRGAMVEIEELRIAKVER